MHKWGEPPEASAQINAGITRCLVQGNIEPRRDYANLIRLAESSPTVRFNIVGKRTKFHATYPSNVRFFFNLNETEYRRACRNNDFVLPMIDPEQHPSYFLNRFSTSVLCGLACSLPFIAHKELFSIYPIHGLSYESFDGLVEQVAVAEKMQESDRKALQADIATSENEIFRQNLGIFERALGEVMANS
jgi:hypothetical protein